MRLSTQPTIMRTRMIGSSSGRAMSITIPGTMRNMGHRTGMQTATRLSPLAPSTTP